MNLKKNREVPIILIDPVSNQTPELAERIAGTLDVRLESCRSWLEAVSRLRRHGIGIALAYLADDSDLSEAKNFLKLLEGGFEKNQFQALVLTPYSKKEAIRKLGFQAVLLPEDLEGALSAVQSSLEKIFSEMGRGDSGKREIRWNSALALKSDFWIFGGRIPKWAADRWVIRVLGPGPGAGSWVQLNSVTWKWQARERSQKNPFFPGSGEWLFKGFFPRFEGESWIFSGQAPRLSFWHEGEELGVKFFEDESGALVLAQDSENALRFLPEIEHSLDQDKRIGAVTQESNFELEALVVEKKTEKSQETHPQARAEFSTLALSLLIAELNLQRDLAPHERIHKIQRYLEWMTQTKQVEFWSQSGGHWKFLGGSDLRAGMLLEKSLAKHCKVIHIDEVSFVAFGSEENTSDWSEKFEREVAWVLQPLFLGA